jgi:hypothetical protein
MIGLCSGVSITGKKNEECCRKDTPRVTILPYDDELPALIIRRYTLSISYLEHFSRELVSIGVLQSNSALFILSCGFGPTYMSEHCFSIKGVGYGVEYSHTVFNIIYTFPGQDDFGRRRTGSLLHATIPIPQISQNMK